MKIRRGLNQFYSHKTSPLTLKAPNTTAADIFFFFSEKTSLDISCELSAWQTIHMKCQDLFSLKNKKKIFFEYRLLQILLGALRVNSDVTQITNICLVSIGVFYFICETSQLNTCNHKQCDEINQRAQ